jgi:hypothetical protein
MAASVPGFHFEVLKRLFYHGIYNISPMKRPILASCIIVRTSPGALHPAARPTASLISDINSRHAKSSTVRDLDP